AAIQVCTAEGWSRLVVATAAADTGNLRFYQRVGFRMHSIERNAFTAENGYPDPVVIDGIRLLDRVWLSQDLPTQDLSDNKPDTQAGAEGREEITGPHLHNQRERHRPAPPTAGKSQKREVSAINRATSRTNRRPTCRASTEATQEAR
ncbi:MAG: hypothetical protein ACRDP9_26305, partial [Kribbellaceae bacterium]